MGALNSHKFLKSLAAPPDGNPFVLREHLRDPEEPFSRRPAAAAGAGIPARRASAMFPSLQEAGSLAAQKKKERRGKGAGPFHLAELQPKSI